MNKNRLLMVCSLLVMSVISLFSPSFCESAEDELNDKIEKILNIVERQNRQLEGQQQTINEQGKRFIDYQQRMEKILADQQNDIEQLRARVNSSQQDPDATTVTTTPAPAKQQPAADSVASASSSQQPETKAFKTPDQPVGRPPEPEKESRPPEIAAIFDQPGVLTPKGSLLLEPSLQYSHSTSKRLFLLGYTILPALHIGTIDLRDVTREAYVAALAARYGLTNRLELELRIPYVYRSEVSSVYKYVTVDSYRIKDNSSNGDGLGDIEFGLRYQLNQPQNGPYYIANLRVKSDTGTDPFEVSGNELPTGSGFWGIQPSLTAIFPSDPAVFFGGINYMWNIARNVGDDFGKLDPGDAYGFNFGMGLALNEKAAFSMGYEHSIISRTTQNGDIFPGQITIHVGNFQLGYSYRLTEKLSLNLSLGIGVTEDAPDVQLTVKMPITL